MEINSTTRKMERKPEFDCIDQILPLLWKKGSLTDFECRIIASANTLVEKKSAVFTIIMSKTKYEAAYLTRIFRYAAVHVEDSTNLISASSKEDSKANCVLPFKTPFLNKSILKHLFGYLSLEDIKESRLVCQQWNSTAEICLRERSSIHFRQNVVMPYTFIEVSKYSHPDRPFPSFVFSNTAKPRWLISHIKGFLKNWEKNIKEVTFDCVSLDRKGKINKKVFLIRTYNVAQLFYNPSNITSLKIKPSKDYDSITQWDISLEKFVSIKTLSLSECRIVFPVENSITRIAPLSIDFDKVTFIHNNAEVLPHHQFNDLIDFSKALNINMDLDGYTEVKSPNFDIGKQELKLNQLHLDSVSLVNWTQAKGEVEFLWLYASPFVEKNYLKIKTLDFFGSKIDLAVLPQTLEALELSLSSYTNEITCRHSLDLPNLKYLCIYVEDKNILTYFSHCPNLVDLKIFNNCKITDDSDFYQISLGSIPKSVKNIRMDLPPIEFTDDCILELDTLSLHWTVQGLRKEDIIAITRKIKAKVLIVEFGNKLTVNTSYFARLVPAIRQSQKFLIGSYSDMYLVTPFEGSVLSNYVDTKSNFYDFENKVGKAITEEEFKRHDFEYYIPDYFYSRSR